MKTRVYFSILATSVFMFASCSSNDNQEMSNDNGRKLRKLTVVQKTQPGTRSSITDQGFQGLSSVWEMGDEMTVYNKTYPSSGYHAIKATSTSKTANFVGTADCEVNDQLRLFYPSIGTEGTVTDPDGNGTLTLDISEQKGTLEDIQQHYDFFYGEATVAEVTDDAAVADADLSQNLATICKFTFKCNKEYVKDISSVEVTNVAPTATFTLSSRTAPTLTPSAAGAINVVAADNIDNSVYVTLFPGETAPSFTVMAADGKYEGTLSAATLQAGKFYNVVVETARTGEGTGGSGSAPDYVEVCGIKWAKGNLEYDPVNGGDPGFMENWRIAPTQWYFVGYDKDQNYNFDEESIKDYFWWNNILSPFDLSGKSYGTTNRTDDISGKFFYSDSESGSDGDYSTTVPAGIANRGDLAYYVSNKQYRLPTNAHIKILVNEASYQWGYYMAGDVKVYGILFTTPNGSRTTSTYAQSVELFDADLEKGLFLPAARRITRTGKVYNYDQIFGEYASGNVRKIYFNNTQNNGKLTTEVPSTTTTTDGYRYSIRPVICE